MKPTVHSVTKLCVSSEIIQWRLSVCIRSGLIKKRHVAESKSPVNWSYFVCESWSFSTQWAQKVDIELKQWILDDLH